MARIPHHLQEVWHTHARFQYACSRSDFRKKIELVRGRRVCKRRFYPIASLSTVASALAVCHCSGVTFTFTAPYMLRRVSFCARLTP